MADYISREAAIKELCDTYEREFPTADGSFDLFAVRIMPKVLRSIPAADVEPVRHGRWVSWEEAENCVPSPDRHECSVCHDAAQVLVNGLELLSDYCPNCGSKMDLEDEK